MPNWKEITTSEEYRALTPEDRATVKAAFFTNHIDPLIEQDPELKKMGRDAVFQDWMRTPDDTGEGLVQSALSSAGRGAASIVPGAVGGAGYVLNNPSLISAGEQIEQSINQMLPVNPIYEDTWTVKIAGAVGQGVGIMGTGLGTGAIAKGLGAVTMAQKAASGVLLTTGGLAGAREHGRIADQLGLTGAERAAYIAAGAGKEIASELMPFGTSIETGVTQVFKGVTKQALTPASAILSEAVEGGASQVMGNIATRAVTPEGMQAPGVFEGLGEAMVLEGAGGVTFAAANALTTGEPSTKAPAKQTEDINLMFDKLGKLLRPEQERQPVNVERDGTTYHRNADGAWGEFREGTDTPFVPLNPLDEAEGTLIRELDNTVSRKRTQQPAPAPVEVPKPFEVGSGDVDLHPVALGRAQDRIAEEGGDFADTVDISTPVPVFRMPDGRFEIANEEDAVRVVAARMRGKPLMIQPAVIDTENAATVSPEEKTPETPSKPAAAPPDATMLAGRFKPGMPVMSKSTGQRGFVRSTGDTVVATTADGSVLNIEASDATTVPQEEVTPAKAGVVPAVESGGEIITGPSHDSIIRGLAGEQKPGEAKGPQAQRGFIIGGQFYNMVDAKTKLESMGIELPNVNAEQRDWVAPEDLNDVDLRTPAERDATVQRNKEALAKLGLDNEPGTRVWGRDQITAALYNMARDESYPKTVRLIADILSRMNMPDLILNIKNLPKGKYAGKYQPLAEGIGEIKINIGVEGLEGASADMAMLHEVLHHVTTWKVHSPASQFEQDMVVNLEKLRVRALSYAKSRAAGGLNDPSTKFAYEMSNVDEFIAGLFTRVDFQQYLASIPSDLAPTMRGRVRSVLQDIFNTIARLVTGADVPHNSVLDSAFGVTLDLIGSGQQYTITSMPGALMSPANEKDAEYLAAVEAGDMEKAQRMVNQADAARLTNAQNERAKILKNLSPESSKDTVDGAVERYSAVHALLDTFTVPIGFTLEEAGASGGGSIYIMARDVIERNADGEPLEVEDFKLSIRNHEPSPFREKEFGKVDKYAEVEDPRNPIEVAEAITKLEQWLDKKGYQQDPITRDGAGNVIPLSQRFQTTLPDIRYSPAADYRFASIEREQQFKDRNPDGSLQKLKDRWKYVNSVVTERTIDGEPVPGLAYNPRRDEMMEAAVMQAVDDLQASGATGNDILLIITSGIQPGSNVPLTSAERAIFTRWLWRSNRHTEFGLTDQQLIKGMQSIASEFGYIGREWQTFLDPITKLKEEADEQTDKAFTAETGKSMDAEFAKLKHELEKAEGTLKYLLRKGIRGQRRENVDAAEKLLTSFRTLMAMDGAKATADAFFRGGEQRASSAGPLVQGADIVKAELRKLLNEALDMVGIERAKAKTPDEFQRIAVALGLDDVRSDKLKEIDKLIRDRIATMVEGAEHSDAGDFADMMLEQWESVSSHMLNSAVSGATSRRVFKQMLKEMGLSIGDLIGMSAKGRATAISNIAEAVTNRVREAGSTADLSNLRKVMVSTGDMLVDAEVQRRAKAAELRNDNQQVAEAVIAQFEKKFSGIPNLDTKKLTGIRKLVDDAIHAREIMPDFVERAMALGVDALTARTLGDMTLEHGRRKAKEREDRKAKAERVRRSKEIARFIKGMMPKEKTKKKRMGKFIRTLLKADELNLLDKQMFSDAFAGAFSLNKLTPAVVTRLRDMWRNITAVDENGMPVHRGMPRETLERMFMEAVNAVSPGARLMNVIFDQYQASALASASSIVNQFSGVFRVIFGVDAFARSFARRDVRGVVGEWWQQVRDLMEALPLVITGIQGESLGIGQSQVKTTFKPGEQKLSLTGEGQTFRIQRADGSTYEMGDTMRKVLRWKELWTWRAIRGAEALSGIVDAKSRFRDVLAEHYTKEGMSPADARKQAWKDIASNDTDRADAEAQALREREAGLISKTDKAQLARRVQEIINERIEARLGQDLISRVEYLTAVSQFKTVPTGLLGYPIYRAFSMLSESKNSLARASKFFLLFGRFLGHTVDTMMAYTPGLSWFTRASDASTSRRTTLIKEYYGDVTAYNKQQQGKAAAGGAFLLMNGMLIAMAEALAGDDEEPFYQVFGMAPNNSRGQREALESTGKWKEGVVRIFGVDIAYSQIPELSPLLTIIGNASDYARFGEKLYRGKEGAITPVDEAAFNGVKDLLASPIKRSTYRQWFTAIDSAMSGRPTDAFANLLTQPVGTALRLPVVVDIDKVFREIEGAKDAKGFGENLIRRIPFVHVGETMLNAYGEELPGLGVIGMFPPDADVSADVRKVATLNVETGTTRSKPRDPEIEGRELTDEERVAFVKLAGSYFVESALRNEQAVRRAYESGGKDAAQKIISNISGKANERARRELGLDE